MERGRRGRCDVSAYSDLVLASNPNAYWRLGESVGATIAHSEVNDATAQSTYSATPPTLGTTGLIAGDANTAATFITASGTDAHGLAHQTFQDVADIFTIECWIKRTSIGVKHEIFGNGDNQATIGILADNTFRLSKLGTADVVVSTITIADTVTAHHLVVTKSAATVKLYIDGIDRTGVVSNQTFANPTVTWHIGADGFGVNQFNGVIDELAFYPTALSQAVVSSHYAQGTTTAVLGQYVTHRGGRGAGW